MTKPLEAYNFHSLDGVFDVNISELIAQQEQRITELEKTNRRFRKYAFVGTLLVVSLVVMGWSSIQEYQEYHGQFFIRDQHGAIRGMVGYDPETNHGKLILGTVGKNSGDGFEFNAKVLLRLDEDGEPWMDMYDNSGLHVMSMGRSIIGPSLTMYDTMGQTAMGLDINGLSFYDNREDSTRYWFYGRNGYTEGIYENLHLDR